MGNVSLSAGWKQQHEHWPKWSPLSPPHEEISSQNAAKELLQSNLQSEHSFWQSVTFFEEKQPATASLSQRENGCAPCCVGLSYKSTCMATTLKFQAKKWRGLVMLVYVSASTRVALCLRQPCTICYATGVCKSSVEEEPALLEMHFFFFFLNQNISNITHTSWTWGKVSETLEYFVMLQGRKHDCGSRRAAVASLRGAHWEMRSPCGPALWGTLPSRHQVLCSLHKPLLKMADWLGEKWLRQQEPNTTHCYLHRQRETPATSSLCCTSMWNWFGRDQEDGVVVFRRYSLPLTRRDERFCGGLDIVASCLSHLSGRADSCWGGDSDMLKVLYGRQGSA